MFEKCKFGRGGISMLFLLMLLGCVKELKNEVIYKGKGDLIKAAREGRKK